MAPQFRDIGEMQEYRRKQDEYSQKIRKSTVAGWRAAARIRDLDREIYQQQQAESSRAAETKRRQERERSLDRMKQTLEIVSRAKRSLLDHISSSQFGCQENRNYWHNCLERIDLEHDGAGPALKNLLEQVKFRIELMHVSEAEQSSRWYPGKEAMKRKREQEESDAARLVTSLDALINLHGLYQKFCAGS